MTLLDIAPTIADLIGLREPNPWQGHSLLSVEPDRRIRFGFRDSLLAESRSGARSATARTGGRALYDARSDWLQQRDVAETGRRWRGGCWTRRSGAAVQ